MTLTNQQDNAKLRKAILDEWYDVQDVQAELNDVRHPCSACGAPVYEDALVGGMCARCAFGENDFEY